MIPKLIGLYSPAPRSGKTTIAEHLADANDYHPLPFAGTLKAMATVLLGDIGYDQDFIKYLLQHNKSAYIPEFCCTIRHLLQTLGTEWGRNLIDRDIWLTVWSSKFRILSHAGHKVVVDDVRFLNEAELIRALGGEMWLIERDLPASPEYSHTSEGGLNDWSGFARRLHNDGDIADLLAQVSGYTTEPQLPNFRLAA